MVSIAVPQSGRARSAARHRERTEGRPLTRRPQTTTRTSSSMNGTAGGATAVNSNHPLASRDPGLIRRGNETIRAAIRTQGLQLVPFFCECSDPRCGQALWIPLADYDERTRTDATILVEGHAGWRPAESCSSARWSLVPSVGHQPARRPLHRLPAGSG